MSRLGLERVAKRFEVDSRGDLLRAQALGCAFADDSGHVLVGGFDHSHTHAPPENLQLQLQQLKHFL